MKTFDKLNDEQKAAAVAKCVTQLLTAICEGQIRFSDEKNGDSLQARIDAAFEKAKAMRTPWFAHEYIMDTCADDIKSMAQADAEDSIYSEGEHVVSGILATAV